VLAVHGDVAVTSAELADRALVAVCEQIGGLARQGGCLARDVALRTTPSTAAEVAARSEIVDASEARVAD